MAKRGRPTKADAALKWTCDRLESIVSKQNEEIKGIKKAWREADAEVAKLIRERDNYIAFNKRQAEEIKALSKTCDLLEMEWRTSDKKLEELTGELEGVSKTAEDRFLSGQVMAKQLAKAEDRITGLLEEIRIYEREHWTLRQIILDGLRRD